MNTRRDFFKTVGVAASAAILSQSTLFASSSTSTAINFNSEYKAIVNIMLLGGNDSLNMLVPFSGEAYNDYYDIRKSVALKQDELIPLANTNNNYSVHHKLPNVATMFDNNELAFIANAGAIVEPTNRDNIKNVPLPRNLFSHNSQQNYWSSLNPKELVWTGWAGRIADKMNTQTILPPVLGVDSNGMWIKSVTSDPLIIGTNGGQPFPYAGHRVMDTMDKIRNEPEKKLNLLQRAYKTLMDKTIAKNDELIRIFQQETIQAELKEDQEETGLMQKLQAIAKIVQLREEFGLPRQMFYVTYGGFDTHNNNNLGPKYEQIDNAIDNFTSTLKQAGLYDKVTTFITSDFGRSVTSNGSGTDHGWGGHYFVFGGSVKGGKIYGTMPTLKVDDKQMYKGSRLIPTTSIEQYVATICKWYGLSETVLHEIFPYLQNFEQTDLGFMKT